MEAVNIPAEFTETAAGSSDFPSNAEFMETAAASSDIPSWIRERWRKGDSVTTSRMLGSTITSEICQTNNCLLIS